MRQEAHVYRYFIRATITTAAIALCGLAAFLATTVVVRAQNAPAAKKWKDQGEYDLYNAIGKDINARNFKQAVTDLDSWKQKYPASDYGNDRDVFYVQSYASSGQPAKSLELASSLIDKGLDTVFADPKTGPSQELTILFTAVVQAFPQVQNPTPEQIAMGQKAAKLLLDFNRKPENVPDAAWQEARTKQLQPPARATLLAIAMQPGVQAMTKKDCAGAETAFVKALHDYPDSSNIAYNLGAAYLCDKKYSEAVYEFERAVALDPTLGGSVKDPKTIQTYADGVYTKLHGSDEGLSALRDTAKATPMPPDGFHVKTVTEIAAEKEAQFEQSNPQLAMWMKIKGALADTNGDQYFTDSLKGSDVPQLKGVLVDAKPACNPKELLVAVPLPDAKDANTAEITLTLDAAMTGKPDANQTFQFKGVPNIFVKDPFMLTFDVEKANVEGLTLEKCVPARPAAKKAPSKKK